MLVVAVLALVAMLALVGCGGSPSGPSPVEAQTAAASPAPSARALPAGLDPAYVLAIAPITESGRPKRWEGGPMHHCFIGADRAVLDPVAERMAVLSGVPRTEAGPCNVTWKVAADPYAEVPVGSANTRAIPEGSTTAILSAVVTFRFAEFARSDNALHEGGHVLGLRHSERSGDLMYNGAVKGTDFSADELSVLAWIYGR